MDPREAYRARRDSLEAARDALSRASRRVSRLRSGAVLGSLALWVLADLTPGTSLLRVAAAGGMVAFVALVRRHRRLQREERRVEAGLDWVSQGIARLDRRWDLLPAPGPARGDLAQHPYAVDLDLFGSASLVSLMGPVRTVPGREALDMWLLEPAARGAATARQEAVRELASHWEQRERVAVEAWLAESGAEAQAGDAGDFAAFLSWCRDEGRLPPFLVRAAWVLPGLLAAAISADVVGWMSAGGWVLVLFAQAAVAYRWGSRLHRQFALASTGVPGLRKYHAVLAQWEGFPARSPLLRVEVERLGSGPDSSSAALRELERLLHLSDARFSTVYPVLAVALLWDLHVVRGLVAWRDRHGCRVAGWMEALGRLEALAALGTLAGDHPDWTYPAFAEEGSSPRLAAGGLGHPLLARETCVRNDVELGPPGTVLLVTGSNMSGKSTLLRSLGLAVVMAEAGAPVCADRVSLPPVRLFTSMRVKDSLEEGVSYFMAELLRLKALLDAAPPRGGSPDAPPLLYLVDEILQGTNSEERQLAGRRLIRHLLRRNAIGAVTTHDLELHRDPRVEESAVLVHFREEVAESGEGLEFDYRLRPGLATTRNALRLAEKVGLTDPDG